MADDATGISDSGVVALNADDGAGFLESAQLQVLRVEDPDRGPLTVPWPFGEVPTLDEVLATLGEPGEVKGPSAAVWGDESAAAFNQDQPLLGVVTPQGAGEPVKGPAEDRDADEVLDPEPDE